MNDSIKRAILSELRAAADRIENDKCALTPHEAANLMSALTHIAMSKDEVLGMLGWSRSKFDDYCARGLMPKGRKRAGWKELVWYRDEVEDSLNKIRREYGIEPK